MVICVLISLAAAIGSGVAIFAAHARSPALDTLFGTAVTVFLGSLVSLVSRRSRDILRGKDRDHHA